MSNIGNWELSSRTIQNYINDVAVYETDTQKVGELLLSHTLGQNRRRLTMLQMELHEKKVVTHDMVQKFEKLVASSEKLIYMAGLDHLCVEDQTEPETDPNQTILFA